MGTVTVKTPLVIIHGLARGLDELASVSGLDHLPRLLEESGEGFIKRLEAYIATNRRGAAPFIGIACYAGDEVGPAIGG